MPPQSNSLVRLVWLVRMLLVWWRPWRLRATVEADGSAVLNVTALTPVSTKSCSVLPSRVVLRSVMPGARSCSMRAVNMCSVTSSKSLREP